MICPICKIGMLVVERNRIELDYCSKCGGTWFDSGELELLLASLDIKKREAFITGIITGPETKTNERDRKCPVCSKKMKKTTIGDSPKILIDACYRGDGLWFDGGELDQFLNAVSDKQVNGAEANQQISTFLKQTFKARNQPQADG